MKQLGAAVDFALHGEDYDDENFSFQVFLAHVYEHKDAVKASIKALIAAVYALVMYEAPLASLLACSFWQAALTPTSRHLASRSHGLSWALGPHPTPLIRAPLPRLHARTRRCSLPCPRSRSSGYYCTTSARCAPTSQLYSATLAPWRSPPRHCCRAAGCAPRSRHHQAQALRRRQFWWHAVQRKWRRQRIRRRRCRRRRSGWRRT